MDKNLLVRILIIGAFVGLTFIIFLIRTIREKKALIPNIVEAEKKRKAHPDIQTGKFTRLYTMPYDEELTGQTITDYFEQRYPEWKYSHRDNYAQVVEMKKGSRGEVRDFYITQLRDENVTAINLVDPNEVVYSGRNSQGNMRTTLYDMGFSEQIREGVRAIQQASIERTTKRK